MPQSIVQMYTHMPSQIPVRHASLLYILWKTDCKVLMLCIIHTLIFAVLLSLLLVYIGLHTLVTTHQL